MKQTKSHMPPDKSAYQKIIFLISQPEHMLWVLKRTVSMIFLNSSSILITSCSCFKLAGLTSKHIKCFVLALTACEINIYSVALLI